jgi:F-type H+-transporting ATPase subunit delta
LQNKTIAKRYGYALFDVYKEISQRELIRDIFSQFVEMLKQYKDLYEIFISPVIKNSEKIKLLEDLLKNMKYEERFLNFLKLLIYNNRFKYIYSIYDFLIDLYNEDSRLVVANLYVAEVPDKSILSDLQNELESLICYKVLFDIKVKKDILGGFMIVLKDKLIDASIKKALDELVEKIKGEV